MFSIGRGYDPRYLTEEVAAGRENYYTGAVAEGEPPGVWWGAGAAALGLAGEVAAHDMIAVYERRLDPRAAGFSDPDRWDSVATLGHGGRAYKSAEQLYTEAIEREPNAPAERRDELRVQASQAERHNLAFLDLTFSVPKSVTLLHTAFEAEEIKARTGGLDAEAAEWAAMRQAVEEAIWAGNRAGLEYLQREAGYARVGHHGGASGRWIDAHRWVVASFFQHDSREHDPQLHIHNGVLNEQECDDGVWRTLDSKAIHRLKPAAGAISDRTVNEQLMDRLWVQVAMREDGVAREVTCVTPQSREMFSTREHKIGAKAAEYIAAFEASKNRPATGLERDRLRRAATMTTRTAKSHQGETREALVTRVDTALRREVAGGLTGIAHAARAAGHGEGAAAPAVGRFDPEQVVTDAIVAAQAKKSSFTHADVMLHIERLLPDRLGLPDGLDVAELIERLADQAAARVERVGRTAPGDELLPDALRKNDHSSAYDAPGGPSYVTLEHLRGENRLRQATAERDGVHLAPSQARAFIQQLREQGIELGVDQAAALSGVLTSGARLQTLIGPAGTGKSFVVGAIARAWCDPSNRPQGQPERRVFGLATAQVAADVLAAEGLTAANIEAWLATQRRLHRATPAAGPVAVAGDRGWRLRRGDIVVVDESAMANYDALVDIHSYVDAAGANMLMTGDPGQLFAIGAGGVMELVAETGARYELVEARRFAHAWERDASLRLREGDPAVIQEYHRHGRLLDCGTLAQAEDSAATAWRADTLAGHRSLLIVDTNDQATRVSGGLREEFVRLGLVDEHGVALRDGCAAGVGDVIQGRRLAWELAGYAGNPRGAKNREHYKVTAVRADGALEVEVLPRDALFFDPAHRHGDGSTGRDPRQFRAADAGPEGADGTERAPRERLVLPAQYVAKDVTLAYAVTKHAVQGDAVYSVHPVITPATELNALYEELSRGTHINLAHVVTVTGPQDPAQGAEERYSVHRDPRAVVGTIFEGRDALDAAHQSATAAHEAAATWAASAQTAAERFADGAHEAARARTARHLDQLACAELLGPIDRARIAAEDGTSDITRALRQAELAGLDPRDVLREAIAGREFDGARRVSDVLLARIHHAGPFEPVVESWAAQVPSDIPPEHAAALAARAQVVDARAAELGAHAATTPPPWALDVLGHVPALHDHAARAAWEARAGLIEVHREIRGHPHPTDDDTTDTDDTADAGPNRPASSAAGAGERQRPMDSVALLGAAPPPRQVEAFAGYRAAHRAADLPQHTREANELSDAGLRARVRAAARVEAWGPAYVDNQLAGTRQTQDHYRQAAQLRRAEAAAAAEEPERERLRGEARGSDAVADTLEHRVRELEAAADTRGHWLADNAPTLAKGHESRAILTERGVGLDPDDGVTGPEWLAEERAARIEDDPHRQITERDLDHRRDNSDIAPRSDQAGQDNTSNEHHHDYDEDAGQTLPESPRAWLAAEEPLAETNVPDVRDGAPQLPPGVDEDTVHTPEPAEIDAVAQRAREAHLVMRERAEREAQHEQHECDQQLTRWHDADHRTDDHTDGLAASSHDAADDDRDDRDDDHAEP